MCCFCDTESTIKFVTVRMVVNLLHTTDGKSAAFVCAYCLVCAVAADRAARARGPGHPRVSIRRGASIKNSIDRQLIEQAVGAPSHNQISYEFASGNKCPHDIAVLVDAPLWPVISLVTRDPPQWVHT